MSDWEAWGDDELDRYRDDGPDWYERRHELMPGHVFKTYEDIIIKLDRRVPGDGTQWYADVWHGHWSSDDFTVEPSDLTEKLSDNYPA